jgi:hypothetical protein
MAATLAGAYLLLVAAIWLLQSHLLYFPQIEAGFEATPAQLGLAFEPVRIRTDDGESLAAWFVPAPDALGVALFFHGNAGTIAHRLDWLPLMQRLRLDTLLVDYRGYGASSGRPSEDGTYSDARASWDYLTNERGIPAERVVLFGESLGGAIAAKLATGTRPRALVLMSAFTSVPDLAAELYPWLPARWISRFRYDTLSVLADVHCPVLVAHSRADEIVPFAHGQRLFQAAREPKAFLELAGGHNSGFVFMREDWSNDLARFLGVTLLPAQRAGSPR